MAYSLVYPIYVSNGKISIFSFFEVFFMVITILFIENFTYVYATH